MLTKDMLSILCCPVCRLGDLRAIINEQDSTKIIEGSLVCEICENSYPIHVGIPDMIPKNVLTSAEWKMWQDHLEGFRERRKMRIEELNSPVTKLGKISRPQKAFSEFTNIKEGLILDVGCGPGKIRFNFNNDNVTYFGVDPIPLLEINDFRYVRALAEFIPYKNHTFTDITVVSALDHFNELDSFFSEIVRVLKPNGKFHIMQSVHEIKGLKNTVKMLAHKVKDRLEDRATKFQNVAVQKHMFEFNISSLFNVLNVYFKIEEVSEFSYKWYYPTHLFLKLTPKESA